MATPGVSLVTRRHWPAMATGVLKRLGLRQNFDHVFSAFHVLSHYIDHHDIVQQTDEWLVKLAKKWKHHTCEKPWFLHLQNLAKIDLWNLAKLCKTMQNYKLWNLATYCETWETWTIFAKLCKSLRKPAKSYLQKLAKPKCFSKSIFVKACKNTFISHLKNLVKTDMLKPNWETVQKVYLLLAPSPPPPCSGWASSSPTSSAWSSVIITVPKPIVSIVSLSFVCPKCFTIHANQPMMQYKVSYTVVSSA